MVGLILEKSMPVLGQTRKSVRFTRMSVLPSTADVVGPARHVRKVPEADIEACYHIRRNRPPGMAARQRDFVRGLSGFFQQIGLAIVNTVQFSTHCDQI